MLSLNDDDVWRLIWSIYRTPVGIGVRQMLAWIVCIRC